MKKYLVISLLLAMTLPINAIRRKVVCDCDCKATGKTFFSVRTPYQVNSPEWLVHFRDRMDAREDGFGGAFQATILGGKSTRKDRITQYFVPECRTELLITEQQRDDTDIRSEHFNIITVNEDFESKIRFEPRHSFVGAGFTWRQRIWERDNGHNVFGWISGPVLRVKNRMNLCEQVVEDGGGVDEELSTKSEEVNGFPLVKNMVEAFKQKAFRCGKIDDCCDNTETRFAHIELALGAQLVKEETCTLESFVGGIFPTGNRPCGTFVFEPIVGNNDHFGAFWGSALSMELWHHDTHERRLVVYVNYNGQYLFSRCERRLVDVKCKPWSRYMQVYCNKDQAQEAFDAGSPDADKALLLHTPGVNIFCLDLKIKPRFAHNCNAAFAYYANGFEGEIGYNLFCRKAECIELGCKFNEQSAFKSLQGDGFTDNVQIICDDLGLINAKSIDDFDDNIIKAVDLDLESAAHPGMIVHTVYGSLGYRWDDREYPPFIGAGASYQFASDNTGMNKWMAWGKLGFSF